MHVLNQLELTYACVTLSVT